MKANITARIDPLHLPFLVKLGKYSSYRDGWNGPDTFGPTKEVIDSAITFIKGFDFSIYKEPFLGLAEDGEINFLWETKRIEIDLGFCGRSYQAKTYSYYAKTKNSEKFKEWMDDNVPVSAPLPGEILQLLKKDLW